MSAILSPCGKYRYRLERDIGMSGPIFAYFGVNPSTADASIDDATVRKWIGFTKVNDGSRFIVGNVFAYRATDVNELAKTPFPFGPDNASHLEAIIDSADILVPCWGNTAKVPLALRSYFFTVRDILLKSGKPIRIFGLTKSCDPLHPLMLPYSTPLVEWRDM